MRFSIGDAEHTGKCKQTRREVFLLQLDEVLCRGRIFCSCSSRTIQRPVSRVGSRIRLRGGCACTTCTSSKKGNQWHFGIQAHMEWNEESGRGSNRPSSPDANRSAATDLKQSALLRRWPRSPSCVSGNALICRADESRRLSDRAAEMR